MLQHLLQAQKRAPAVLGAPLQPSSLYQRLLKANPGALHRSRRARNCIQMAQHGQRSLDSHSGEGAKVVAAAAERNKDAILQVLKAHLTCPQGTVLEVASGTGQHSAHFAAGMPHLNWQPTEYSPDCFASIEAWREGLPNMLPPAALDAAKPGTWPAAAGSCCGVLCINMCHISPVACTQGLVRGAARALAPGGHLFIYGPFLVDGNATTESNAAFDASLRARNPEWGYRDAGEVAGWAAEAGLRVVERVSMPANNFTLVFQRGG